MSESSNDKSRERRRPGPLGDDDEKTRQQPPQKEEETRQILEQQSGSGEPRTRRPDRRQTRGGEDGTRVMNSPGARRPAGASSGPTSGGYFEAMEEREERLRDIYGGTDWLASFVGFVFTLVAGAVLALIPALILIPLGFTLDLSGSVLGTAAITGLVIIGVILFLMYFVGGYVSGRLARFDGGINGVMLIIWTIVAGILFLLAGGIFSGFLPAGFAENVQSFTQENILPGFNNLVAQGAIGIGILVSAVLIALLGAFVGGRTGGRYHRDIDYTL